MDLNPVKFIERKSSFFGYAFDIDDELKVKDIILQIKKKHKGAKHICYGFIIEKDGELIQRWDDAGEPSRTAGFPLLKILEQKKLTNKLIVVARKFGGVKLGTSGLIKAYRQAGLLALEKYTN